MVLEIAISMSRQDPIQRDFLMVSELGEFSDVQITLISEPKTLFLLRSMIQDIKLGTLEVCNFIYKFSPT